MVLRKEWVDAMDQALFDEIKKSLHVITEGNWSFVCHDNEKISLIATKSDEVHQVYKEQEEWIYLADFLGTTRVCDTSFIANSKKYVQALIEEVETLRKERDRWKAKAQRRDQDV